MPFTPYHFGPGLFLKSLIPGYFSWTAFVISQVIIDFETLYYLVQGAYPVHRFFHTFAGATLAGLVTWLLLIVLKRIIERLLRRSGNFSAEFSSSLKAELSNYGMMVGALIGGVSHPFLDGVMHLDVRPFSPWSDKNPFLGTIDVEQLHILCLAAGVIGFIILAIRLYRERRADESWP